jgi:hypothetical protein
MEVFDECIGRQHPLDAVSRAHYGSVVTNTDAQIAPKARWEFSNHSFDQYPFTGH